MGPWLQLSWRGEALAAWWRWCWGLVAGRGRRAAGAGQEQEQGVGWQQGLASELLKSSCFLRGGYLNCVVLWMVLK